MLGFISNYLLPITVTFLPGCCISSELGGERGQTWQMEVKARRVAEDAVKSSAAFLAAPSKDCAADFPRAAFHLHPLSHVRGLGSPSQAQPGVQVG